MAAFINGIVKTPNHLISIFFLQYGCFYYKGIVRTLNHLASIFFLEYTVENGCVLLSSSTFGGIIFSSDI